LFILVICVFCASARILTKQRQQRLTQSNNKNEVKSTYCPGLEAECERDFVDDYKADIQLLEQKEADDIATLYTGATMSNGDLGGKSESDWIADTIASTTLSSGDKIGIKIATTIITDVIGYDRKATLLLYMTHDGSKITYAVSVYRHKIGEAEFIVEVNADNEMHIAYLGAFAGTRYAKFGMSDYSKWIKKIQTKYDPVSWYLNDMAEAECVYKDTRDSHLVVRTKSCGISQTTLSAYKYGMTFYENKGFGFTKKLYSKDVYDVCTDIERCERDAIFEAKYCKTMGLLYNFAGKTITTIIQDTKQLKRVGVTSTLEAMATALGLDKATSKLYELLQCDKWRDPTKSICEAAVDFYKFLESPDDLTDQDINDAAKAAVSDAYRGDIYNFKPCQATDLSTFCETGTNYPSKKYKERVRS